MKKILIVAFTLIIITTIGCGKEDVNANINQKIKANLDISFEIIDAGLYSGVIAAENYVVTDQESWSDLWQEIHASLISAPETPVVDFNQETIIAVTMGQKNTSGYNIVIENISEDEDNITINITQTKPETGSVLTQALTQPYQIVKINKTNKNIIFN